MGDTMKSGQCGKCGGALKREYLYGDGKKVAVTHCDGCVNRGEKMPRVRTTRITGGK